MRPQEILWETWAPRGAAWSDWVKPVVFAHLWSESGPGAEIPTAGAAAAPQRRDTAYVLDLPGAAGVLAWAKLGLRGWAPVPLYNAAPGPMGTMPLATVGPADIFGGPPAPIPEVPLALCDVHAIGDALRDHAGFLTALHLPADAPPAFLLDATRRTGTGSVIPRRFDNRSVCFPTDFPSANFLLSRGINRAVLIQEADAGTQPQPDLAHTLRRWQEAGLSLFVDLAGDGQPSGPLDVPSPTGFRSLWHNLLARFGYRRNELGGFGSEIPVPSSG